MDKLEFHLDKKSYAINNEVIPDEGIAKVSSFLYSVASRPNVNFSLTYDQYLEFSRRYTVGSLSSFVDNYYYNNLSSWYGSPIRNEFINQIWPIIKDEEHYNVVSARLKRFFDDRNSLTFIVPDLSILGDAWVNEKGLYRGSYIKRLSKLLSSQIKLTDQQLETIGNLLSEAAPKNGKFELWYDRDYLTNPASEYCHDRSCWWNKKKGARQIFHDNGGWALREGGPTSRCWITPIKDSYVIFNAYGSLSLKSFANLIRKNLKTKECNLLNNRRYDGILHINNGKGILIGKDLGSFGETVDLKYSEG